MVTVPVRKVKRAIARLPFQMEKNDNSVNRGPFVGRYPNILWMTSRQLSMRRVRHVWQGLANITNRTSNITDHGHVALLLTAERTRLSGNHYPDSCAMANRPRCFRNAPFLCQCRQYLQHHFDIRHGRDRGDLCRHAPLDQIVRVGTDRTERSAKAVIAPTDRLKFNRHQRVAEAQAFRRQGAMSCS